jgi:phosphonate transport system ATP-binding protein
MLIDSQSLGYGGTTVLTGVSFALAPGERVALLGRSGAGKTTLLGALHAALLDAGHRVALVPQEHGLVPQLCVTRNTLMGRLDDHGPLYNLGNLIRPRAVDRAGVGQVLEVLGLAPQARRAVEGLSGGQKQRVALARALWRGGDVLLGDEPVSALDETQGGEILHQIACRFDRVVLALHDVDQAFGFATRIVGLKNGRIVLDAAPLDIPRSRIEALYA